MLSRAQLGSVQVVMFGKGCFVGQPPAHALTASLSLLIHDLPPWVLPTSGLWAHRGELHGPSAFPVTLVSWREPQPLSPLWGRLPLSGGSFRFSE